LPRAHFPHEPKSHLTNKRRQGAKEGSFGRSPSKKGAKVIDVHSFGDASPRSPLILRLSHKAIRPDVVLSAYLLNKQKNIDIKNKNKHKV